jgi:hypothetical protein
MPFHEFRATRRVEFNETDLAGIVHFSNFFRYMETVEGAFYRSFGQSVILRVPPSRWGCRGSMPIVITSNRCVLRIWSKCTCW